MIIPWHLAVFLSVGGDVPPVAQAPAVLVLPVRIQGAASGDSRSAALMSALSHQLELAGGYRVLSTQDMDDVLRSESMRQLAGCADDGCLRELTLAVGAQFVLTSDVAAAGSSLVWTASLVREDNAQVAGRAQVQGQDTESLLSQAQDLALELTGREGMVRLEGESAQRRLGFATASDLQTFRTWRQAHPHLSVSDALTTFIKERNARDWRVSILASTLLVGATAGALVAAGAVLLSIVASLYIPVIAVALALIGGVATVAAVAAGVAGVVVVALRVLNPGTVKVRKSGCCRDDAELRDASNDDGVHRAAALAVLFTAPWAVSGMITLFALAAFFSEVAPLLPRRNASAAEQGVVFASLVPVLGPAMCTPALSVLCGLPVGLLFLLWPARPLLEAPAVDGDAP